ncbi:MAG TPA: hypothetical protein VLC91_00755 [Spongiibacteraceae bacterium]|nr:hypothetical protein [Spongiibacteraceae bacterium]
MNRVSSSAWRSAALGFFVAVLTACGGGGGGGGSDSSNGNGSQPGTTDAAHAYFPTDTGIRWTYEGLGETSFSTFTGNNGAIVHSLNYPSGAREYFTTSADQIGLYGLFLHSITVGDGVTYTGDVQFDSAVPILRDSWKGAYSQAVSGKGSINISPTYGKQSLTYSGTVSYAGDDDLSTSLAGFDAKVLMIRLTLTVTVQGQTFNIPYEVDFEVAEGVGIVKRKQGDTSYEITAMTGFDPDRDGVYGAADQSPGNVGLWETGPLYASDDGIAFVSLPSYNRLTQTVTVMAGNRAASVPWVASSDQSWLAVTPLSDGQLKLTADPAGLAADALHYATVSVTQSSGADQFTPASIRVALWVGSQDADPSATLQSYIILPGFSGFPPSLSKMAVDPLRPYVYVNNASSISIYNIYTKALVDSIPVTLGGGEPLRVSTDGSFLYTGGAALHRIKLDAPYAQSSSENVIAGVDDFAYAKPQGHPVLFDGRSHLFDAITLKTIDRYWFPGREFAATAEASVLGNRACLATNGYFVLDPVLSCYELAYISGGGGDVRFRRTGTRTLSSNYIKHVMRDDGENVYLARQNTTMVEVSESWSVGESPTYTPPASAPLTELAVDADGILYYGSSSVVGVGSSNNVLHNLPDAGQSFRVSADGAMLIGLEPSGVRLTRTY